MSLATKDTRYWNSKYVQTHCRIYQQRWNKRKGRGDISSATSTAATSRHNSSDACRPGARPPQLYLQPYLSIGSEKGTASGEMDGTRTVVGNDVVRRLAIVRIDAASGAGWVGSHRAGGWGL